MRLFTSRIFFEWQTTQCITVCCKRRGEENVLVILDCVGIAASAPNKIIKNIVTHPEHQGLVGRGLSFDCRRSVGTHGSLSCSVVTKKCNVAAAQELEINNYTHELRTVRLLDDRNLYGYYVSLFTQYR